MLTIHSLQEFTIAIASLKNIKIGYTRVSTENKEQDTSIFRQIEDFDDAGCHVVCVERESGRDSDSRPLYSAILETIKSDRGVISSLYCTTSSRLNRNAAESIYLDRLCSVQEVSIVFLDQPELNTGGISSEHNRFKEAFSADLFSKQLSFSVKKGYQRAMKNKKVLSKTPVFGYRINSDKNYEIDYIKQDLSNAIAFKDGVAIASGELAQIIIQEYLRLETAGSALESFKKILRSIEPCDSSKMEKLITGRNKAWVLWWLKSPVIRGHLVYGVTKQVYYGDKLEKVKWVKTKESEWIIHRNTHEAIGCPSDLREVDRLIEFNKNKAASGNKGRGIPSSFSGVLICSKCLSRYHKHTKLDSTTYYVCAGRTGKYCSQKKSIRQDRLIDSLIDAIIGKSNEVADYLSNIEEPDIRYQTIESLKIEAEQALVNYKANSRQSYYDLYRQINQEIEDIQQSISNDQVDSSDKDAIKSSISDIEFWNSLSTEEVVQYLIRIIKKAWINNKAVIRIELNF